MKYVLLLLLMISPTSIFAQDTENESEVICDDIQTCTIPYVRLSTQETEPFLFHGRIVDNDFPRFEDYAEPQIKFPDVRSCLVEEERDKLEPDLRKIDWDAIENSYEIHVCVFRITASIEDIEYIKIWLQYQGFRIKELSPIRNSRYVLGEDRYEVIFLPTSLPMERYKEIIPRSWFSKLTGFELVQSFTLSIGFTLDGKIYAVSTGGSSILN